MARMTLLTTAAAGGRRRLVDLWATAPAAYNWQEPLGQAPIPGWHSWSCDTKNMVVFAASLLALIAVFFGVIFICLFCRAGDDEEEQDTCRDVLGLWSNDDDDDDNGEPVSAPLQQQEQQPPSTSWDDVYPPQSNSGEGGRPPRRQRRRRRQRPAPTVPEEPAADDDVELAMGGMGDVQLTQVGVEWMLANSAGVEIAPVADMEEMAPSPEPAPTLKCTFSTAEGWTEGTCSVCLSELVDGQKVRVLTACMHCFHATCVEKWLRENATCPLCRAPTMAVPARGRRRRQTQTVTADPDVRLAY